MVATSEISLSVTLDAVEHLAAIREDLAKIAIVEEEADKSLICLVGEKMREQPGIAARAFSAIRGTNLQMISQGANGISMSFVVEDSVVEQTVRSLHAEFFADADPGLFDVSSRAAQQEAVLVSA